VTIAAASWRPKIPNTPHSSWKWSSASAEWPVDAIASAMHSLPFTG